MIAAISENMDKLQSGEISVCAAPPARRARRRRAPLPRAPPAAPQVMPEGLVKISSSLFASVMPSVKAQVESQIKVRDLSDFGVAVTPSEYSSWSDARSALMLEAKRGLKSQLAAELVGASEAEQENIRAAFRARESAIENDLDHQVFHLDATLQVDYNFLSED